MSNDEKLNYIYNKYNQYLLRICYKYAKNEEEAHDYMHDAFIKINNVIDKIDVDACKTYITKIAINNSIDNIRKQKNKQTVVLDDVSESKLDHTDDTDYNSLKEFIINNASKLGDTHYKIFTMYVFDDYKHREIAEILDMNVNTVRVDFMKAKNKIKTILKNEINKDKKIEVSL